MKLSKNDCVMANLCKVLLFLWRKKNIYREERGFTKLATKIIKKKSESFINTNKKLIHCTLIFVYIFN